jgi:DNA-directed RNA polymerase sigma subunit (sigma70/sigma32)
MDQGAAEAFYRRAMEAYARGESLVGRRVPQEQHMEMLRQRLLEGLTLGEIGQRHGMTAERIRQLLHFYFGLTGRLSAQR